MKVKLTFVCFIVNSKLIFLGCIVKSELEFLGLFVSLFIYQVHSIYLLGMVLLTD